MRTSSIIRPVHRSSRHRHGSGGARTLLLAAGLLAGAALTTGRAHAQIDPYRTAVSHPTTGIYQVLGGSWGWERALVGEIYIEDAGLGGAGRCTATTTRGRRSSSAMARSRRRWPSWPVATACT